MCSRKEDYPPEYFPEFCIRFIREQPKCKVIIEEIAKIESNLFAARLKEETLQKEINLLEDKKKNAVENTTETMQEAWKLYSREKSKIEFPEFYEKWMQESLPYKQLCSRVDDLVTALNSTKQNISETVEDLKRAKDNLDKETFATKDTLDAAWTEFKDPNRRKGIFRNDCWYCNHNRCCDIHRDEHGY